jgi:hypothetical protein
MTKFWVCLSIYFRLRVEFSNPFLLSLLNLSRIWHCGVFALSQVPQGKCSSQKWVLRYSQQFPDHVSGSTLCAYVWILTYNLPKSVTPSDHCYLSLWMYVDTFWCLDTSILEKVIVVRGNTFFLCCWYHDLLLAHTLMALAIVSSFLIVQDKK